MKTIEDYSRVKRLILSAIESLELNLEGMSVLTEAASGNFIGTPLLAAMAHAKKVYVCTNDSIYGRRSEVIQYLELMIRQLNIDHMDIEVINNKLDVAESTNIVTNLGFVRPITKELIQKLPRDAAIALMWESWEIRNEDIAIDSCQKYGIPIMGTKETDKRLDIFKYVGMTVLKLLLEQGIEVLKSNLVLVSSGSYLEGINFILKNNGANVFVVNPLLNNYNEEELKNYIRNCDAIIFAEQKSKQILLSQKGIIDIKTVLEAKTKIIHLAGIIDYTILRKWGLKKYPEREVPYGYMTVTTDYLGIRPVVELHTAGLKVGQSLVEGIRKYHDVTLARQYALLNSPAMLI